MRVRYPGRAILVVLEFGNDGSPGGWKTGVPGENPSEQGEKQQQTQPTSDDRSRIYRTRATLVQWDCTIIAP